MHDDLPPILDYRTRRVGTPSQERRVTVESAILLVLGSLALLAGCGAVFGAILEYATSAEPFSDRALLVALVLLVASIAFGLSLLSFRFAVRRRRDR